MGLDISPPNFQGLAGVAGGINNVNLTVPGSLGLQAMQLFQAQQAANQQAALDRMKLGQAELSDLRQNDLQQQQLNQQGLFNQDKLDFLKQQDARQGLLDQARLGQDQSKLDLLNQQGQQENAFKQGDLDIRNKQLALEQSKLDFTKLLQQDQKTIQEKGAFAAYAKYAMDNAKTPEEAQQIRNEILNEASNKHYLSDTELKAAYSMPLSQFKNSLAFQVLKYDKVKDYKDLMAKNNSNSPQTNLKIMPDGTIEYTQNPTQSVQSQAQKDVMFANDNLKQLQSIYNNIPDNFFGAAALKQPGTKMREWAQAVPGLGSLVEPSSEDKTQLDKYSNLKGNTEMMAMNVIKQLSGVQYSDKQLEFLKEILPDIGPGTVKSEFKGRVDNLNRFFNQIKQDREDLLKNGFQVGTPEYEQQLLNKMQTHVMAPTDENSGLREYLKQKGYSDDEINKALAGK